MVSDCHSAGKSLVAEVLMLRRILSSGKKALLVLPYVTLCSEKVMNLASYTFSPNFASGSCEAGTHGCHSSMLTVPLQDLSL